MSKTVKQMNREQYLRNKERILAKAKAAHQKATATKSFNELVTEFATANQLKAAKYLHSLLPEFGIKPDYMALLYREYERSKSEMDFKQWLVERLNNAD
ncbi:MULTISPECIES: hypothetical protein [Vibrio]|uniref:hypothetical protein n=1 Tax=Vibrio TaxID=662 RepID=UPI000C83EFA8|nr:hypothetical protein [Vibrio breoganii]PMP03096.1 hypothetical protein BCS95_09000 [Vibrio breoganii]